MMERFRFPVFLVIALCSTANHAVARTTADTTRIHELDEVRVPGSRAREVIPVQTLSGKELHELSAHSVADAVRYFSGVQVKDYGGIGGLKTVNIRGMGTQHVGVFLDGVELGNAQNGIVDLGRFSLENMESISLYNGQKSNIFQPAKDFASASSIYMTTRVPVFDGEKRCNMITNVKGGSFGTINPAALLEQRLSNTVSLSFNAEYMYTTGKYKFSYKKKNGYDTTGIRQNGDVRALRVEQGFSAKIKNGEWKAKAYFYHSERGYPGAAVREDPGKFKHQDRQWDSNIFLQSSLRKGFGQYHDMLLSAKYARDDLHYRSDPRLDATTMYVDNRYKQREFYISSAHRATFLDGWSASLSADFQWNSLNADLLDFVYPRRYAGWVAVATAVHLPRFKLQASVLGTFVHETTRVPAAAAADKRKYTPTLVVSWQPARNIDLHLRAFYKKIFRMPTLNDLYYTFIGNKDLNPEYTVQYNIGVTRAFYGKRETRVEIQLDAYYNKVTGKIIAMPTSNQFRWTMINLGIVEIQGVDAAIIQAWQIDKHLHLNARVNYTYQKARDLTDPANSYHGDQIPYIPVNSASFILGGSYTTWALNYSFIYTGERYNASANIPENHEKPWYTSDISLSRTFRWTRRDVKLTAEINNLFDQQYEVVRCYPMPGTNFRVALNIIIL